MININLNMLLPCGLPRCCPEPTSSENGGDEEVPLGTILLKSAVCYPRYDTVDTVYLRFVQDCSLRRSMEVFHIPDYTLIMLSAYSRWSLKAPTYLTLPIQVMARIAETEEADDI